MKKKLLLLPLALLLSNCSVVVDSLVDSALERDQYKDDVRSHLRHGDSIGQAERGAREDQMFRDLGAWN